MSKDAEMLFFESKTNDPEINLATEEYLLKEKNEEIFMLWQNDRSVILGAYQNAYEEVDIEKAKECSVKIVRRITGGGAVYHDMGNVNFSFIGRRESKDMLDFQMYMERIEKAINMIGAKAVIKGRNDILINGKKVSGNAQHICGDRVLHHGTLLFDSDFSIMDKVLKGERKGFTSKADMSNRKKVANIKECLTSEMDIEEFKISLLQSILSGDRVQLLELDENDKRKIKSIAKEKYRNWDWNIGSSPRSKTIQDCEWEGGHANISMEIVQGRINKIDMTGDFFAGEKFHESLNSLVGCKVEKDGLESAVEKCANMVYGLTKEKLLNWIVNSE